MMPGAGAQSKPISRSSRVLIVDDDPGQRSLLHSFLAGQGLDTVVVSSGEAALEVLASQPIHMMVSDVRMPGLSGLDTLREARRLRPDLPVLLVTAYADVRDAVDAMRDGAVNYLAKPIDLDELLASVRRATGSGDRTPATLPTSPPLPETLVARSQAMREVLREAALVAPSDSRVLITGESGVGKEVVADVIHRWSPRAAGPLIKINCAAIPDTLLESELFGHEKGAFTGAHAARIGHFEEATDGTLLLDEIGEIPPLLQAKLLRVTEDGTFQRVGSNRTRTSGARMLVATNRNLEESVRRGEFREDLFFRLNVIEIHVPPLRERPSDIMPLATRFLREFARGNARFSPAVTACLEGYAWPGNVRELRNAMERAILMSHGELVLPEHLPARVRGTGAGPDLGAVEAKRLEDVERATILQTLRDQAYHRTETARVLGISRRALTYKLQRYKEQGYAIDP